MGMAQNELFSYMMMDQRLLEAEGLHKIWDRKYDLYEVSRFKSGDNVCLMRYNSMRYRGSVPPF
jgi:hypothetical protein